MKLTSLILEQLEREAELTRRALEKVPEGKNGWKPHEKSMAMGVLAHLVATMPSWISMIIQQDELDLKPKNGGQSSGARKFGSTRELIESLEKNVADARRAVSGTSDEKLETPWRLLEGGKVVQEDSRYAFIFENFHHLAHHRGQLTVYLRLNEAQVPAIYGPSADDHRF